MDKITRLLLLYSRLTNGERINKTIFCLENDCSPRTFDRDIEDVRIHLSEIFSYSELKYDRGMNDYSIEGVKRKLLESTEYLLIEQILKDSAVLRKDEFDTLLEHLSDNTEMSKHLEKDRKVITDNYKPPLHNKSLLKMQGDLMRVIRTKKCIKIKYFKNNDDEVNRQVIPCEVKFEMGYLYLIAYRSETEDIYPAYYRLDRIDSFEILKEQSHKDQTRVKNYLDKYSEGIISMYGGEYITVTINCTSNFCPYILDRFRNARLKEQGENESVFELNVFEGGFIKWIMSQPTEYIRVISPTNTVNKIKEEAKKIMLKYGGMS
jgi:helix-turn-helix type 11 domain protein